MQRILQDRKCTNIFPVSVLKEDMCNLLAPVKSFSFLKLTYCTGHPFDSDRHMFFRIPYLLIRADISIFTISVKKQWRKFGSINNHNYTCIVI